MDRKMTEQNGGEYQPISLGNYLDELFEVIFEINREISNSTIEVLKNAVSLIKTHSYDATDVNNVKLVELLGKSTLTHTLESILEQLEFPQKEDNGKDIYIFIKDLIRPGENTENILIGFRQSIDRILDEVSKDFVFEHLENRKLKNEINTLIRDIRRYSSDLQHKLTYNRFIDMGTKVRELKTKLEPYCLNPRDHKTGAALQIEPFIDQAYKNVIGKEKHVAISFIDFDNLKAINERYGHINADLILREFVEGIREALKGYSFRYSIARVGGDEFALAVEDTNSIGMEGIIQTILPYLKAYIPITINNRLKSQGIEIKEGEITYSIGISSPNPINGENVYKRLQIYLDNGSEEYQKLKSIIEGGIDDGNTDSCKGAARIYNESDISTQSLLRRKLTELIIKEANIAELKSKKEKNKITLFDSLYKPNIYKMDK